MPPKNIETNHNVEHHHVIHGNKGNLHSRKRKIYSIKTMTSEIVLQLIIKRKLYRTF
jgi:hypothetical protein